MAAQLTNKEAASAAGVSVVTWRRWRKLYRIPIAGWAGESPMFERERVLSALRRHARRMAKQASRKAMSKAHRHANHI